MSTREAAAGTSAARTASRSRRVATWAGVLLINLALLEVVCFVMVHLLGFIRPEYRLDHFLNSRFARVDDTHLQNHWATHDPRLGWDNKPGREINTENLAGDTWVASFGADGARHDGHDEWPLLMASYGESHTECQEVNPHQTWQYFVEQVLHRDAKNYGVGGFGPGQAVLKLERHLQSGFVAPVTLLCIHEENINRVVNRYRPFYSPETQGTLAFKPAYRVRDGEIRFFPNPAQDTSLSIAELRQLAHDVARDDYWSSTRLWLVPEFPYLRQGLRVIDQIYRRAARKLWERPVYPDLWHTRESPLIMRHLVMRFREAVRANGSRPILMFLPHTHDWNDGRDAPSYASFVAELTAEFPDLRIIDISEIAFDEERYNILPYRGHISEYGNRLIARRVVEELRSISGILEVSDSAD